MEKHAHINVFNGETVLCNSDDFNNIRLLIGASSVLVNVSSGTPESVSYTHLDVYKRQ